MGLKTTSLRIYFFALGLGFRALTRGLLVEGFKLLIMPVGYWRLIPNALTYEEFRRLIDPRILDVSSPKLLSVFLAGITSKEVIATDLSDEKIFSRWKPVAEAAGLENYLVEYQDARHLTYSDDSFDLVYSISVIEHIPDHGDTAALEEFRRVLKPGGTLIVQVPYRRQAQEIHLDRDSRGNRLMEPCFYERHYDHSQVKQRLEIDGLCLTRRVITGEWIPMDPLMNAATRLPRIARLLLQPLEPILALMNFWARDDDTRGHPLGTLLVYRKVLKAL
jgi:SAM-dependent methyltransferase